MFDSTLLNKFQKLETPFYYYDLSLLEKTLAAIKKEAGAHHYHIHYALKANANKEVLQLVKAYGLGADCVSGNEVKRAIECGFENKNIVFAGVGKSDTEIIF